MSFVVPSFIQVVHLYHTYHIELCLNFSNDHLMTNVYFEVVNRVDSWAAKMWLKLAIDREWV